MKNPIIILGAGLTGLSAAYHLNTNYHIFEKEDEVGGLCRSHIVNGFSFDYTGHLLFFKKS
ncbi:MAG: NAD(P)-binding protein [bacterium]